MPITAVAVSPAGSSSVNTREHKELFSQKLTLMGDEMCPPLQTDCVPMSQFHYYILTASRLRKCAVITLEKWKCKGFGFLLSVLLILKETEHDIK